MDNLPNCPICHTQVRPSDFYCFNCGKNLHEEISFNRPLTITGYFIGSIILPPMGIIWGLKYLKIPNTQSKIIGLGLIAFTLAIIFIILGKTMDFYNRLYNQINIQYINSPGL